MKIKSNALRAIQFSASLVLLSTTIPIVSHAQTASNVRCNGCVASSDLRNNAVSGIDIKNNSVAGKDIKNNSLSGADIKDGSITGRDIKNRSIGFDDLAPDAIHMRTVTVSPVGGNDTAANGDALVAALADVVIAQNFDFWQIRLEPGVYDVGTSQLNLPAGVSIHGSGATNTIIVGGGTTSPIVALNSSTELRDVSLAKSGDHDGTGSVLKITGDGWRVNDINIIDGTDSRITAVRVGGAACTGDITNLVTSIDTGTGRSDGLQISCTSGLVVVTNVLVEMTGSDRIGLTTGGDVELVVQSSSILNSNLLGAGSNVTIIGSRITGSTFLSNGSHTIISTQIAGGHNSGGAGIAICHGAYNGALALNSTCGF